MLTITAKQAKTIAANPEIFESVTAILGPNGQGGYGPKGNVTEQTAAIFAAIYSGCVNLQGADMDLSLDSTDEDLATLFAKAVQRGGRMAFIIEKRLKILAVDLGIADELTAKLG